MGIVLRSNSNPDDDFYLYAGGIEYYVPNSLSLLPLLKDKIEGKKMRFGGVAEENFFYDGQDCSIEIGKSNDFSDNMTVSIDYHQFPVSADEKHNMKVEIVLSGSDLVSMRGIVYDGSPQLVQSGESPVYSFGIKDGKLILKYYDVDQASMLEAGVPLKLSNDTSISGETNELLPDNNNVAVIDVSDCSVEDICQRIVKYLHDSDFKEMNDEIANNSLAKKEPTL